MYRTFVGIGVGAISGAVAGVFVGGLYVIRPAQPESTTVFLGSLLAGAGAITGAVAGGVADLLAFGREALARLNVVGGPEADYREPKPPTGPPA